MWPLSSINFDILTLMMENNTMKIKNFVLIAIFLLALCIGSQSSQAQYQYYDTSTPQGQQGYMQQQELYAQQQQARAQQQMLEQQQRQQQQMQQQQYFQQLQQQQQQESDPFHLTTPGQW
jgi:opacity protein-like surface antigen